MISASAATTDQQRSIIEYVLIESPEDEVVTHAELISTQHVLGETYEIWDVWTKNSGRWWVITSPTNLYAQADFKSMDVAFSFHLGVMFRLRTRDDPHMTDESRDELPGPWRRYEQAKEALERADEAEEFQAVGMCCREALLDLVQQIAEPEMVPKGQDPPKDGDFVHWSEVIANYLARGPSAARIRSHLKEVAQSTWQLVGWLTHAKGATYFDGTIVIHATGYVASQFSEAVIRHRRGVPDRCPKCSSYRVSSAYRPENREGSYITVCRSCGWEDAPQRDRPDHDLPGYLMAVRTDEGWVLEQRDHQGDEDQGETEG